MHYFTWQLLKVYSIVDNVQPPQRTFHWLYTYSMLDSAGQPKKQGDMRIQRHLVNGSIYSAYSIAAHLSIKSASTET